MNGKAFLKALYYTVASFTVVIVLWQVAGSLTPAA